MLKFARSRSNSADRSTPKSSRTPSLERNKRRLLNNNNINPPPPDLPPKSSVLVPPALPPPKRPPSVLISSERLSKINAGCGTRSALKKKYDFQRAVEKLVEKLDLNLDNISEQESGYGSDLDSLLPPPPVPRRLKSVKFDAYVLLLEGLRERDSTLIRTHIREVNSHALVTEEITMELLKAVIEGSEWIVREILHYGGNANAVEPNTGLTALHLAATKGDLPIVKLLLNHGAGIFVRAPSSGQIPSDMCHNHQGCLAYIRCMEECLGVANEGLVHVTHNYRTSRTDELSVTSGEAVYVIRKGDYKGSNWFWCRNTRNEEGYILQDLMTLNRPTATNHSLTF